MPISLETWNGAPITAHGRTVILQSRALLLRWRNGGFVWATPAALLVQEAGVTRRLPIVDVTRIGLLALGALAALCGLASAAAQRRR